MATDEEIMKPKHYDMPIPPIEYILKNDLDFVSRVFSRSFCQNIEK